MTIGARWGNNEVVRVRDWYSRRHFATLAYSALALPLGLISALWTLVLLLVGGVLSITTLGLWVLAFDLRSARALATVHQSLAHRLLGAAPPTSPASTSPSSGVLAWRRGVLTDANGWRAVGFLLVKLPLAPIMFAFAVFPQVYGVLLIGSPLLGQSPGIHWDFPLYGLALLVVAPPLTRGVAMVERALVQGMLAPNPLAQRVQELEERRTSAVDDAAATVRRIERDLHDGTQARLVGLGMTLAMVNELLAAGAPAEKVRELVSSAQGNAKEAIEELRDLVRGIHPPVLDRGLKEAVTTLASGASVPVTMCFDRPIGKLSPALESIAYFCVAEMLTNVSKHSGARQAEVRVEHDDARLRLRVTDDGRGGATPAAGGGLAGLIERVHTVDGVLRVDSPLGGPTVVTVELPT
jgi:signal transduction histidine kinase